MQDFDRRQGLLAAGAAAMGAVLAGSVRASEGPFYDYLFLDFKPTREGRPAPALARRLKARPAAGFEVVGLFQPQLGWHSRQAGLLLRRAPSASGVDQAIEALGHDPGIQRVVHDRLTPTARPAAGDQPAAGGIYVHRWFAVVEDAVPEFVQLSVQGWRDFEGRFETRIFGLFQADRTEADRQQAATRMLLITRYRDHGVWEASRDPTTDAMASFARRGKLTLDSWAASTLLVQI
jgi:hypothetical protein